jgi:hypothetical protein
MTRSIEDTALSTRTEYSTELAPSYGAAAIEAEIQSSIMVALRFPRNEDQAFAKLMRACSRTSFAEDAAYSFPRGGQTVSGPSVNLAREAARVWGNIRYGVDIVRDDETSRQIRGWAWDLETNTKTSAEDDFQKLVYRKEKKKDNRVVQPAGWYPPDERDLRELTNRRAAILKRNCILELLPKDLIEDALDQSASTLRKGAEQDPEAARKKIILAFGELNVTPAMLDLYLTHPLTEASPAEIADLRKIYKSISDGNSKWAEYVHAASPEENGRSMPQRKSDTEPQAEVVAEVQTETTDAPTDKSAELRKKAENLYLSLVQLGRPADAIAAIERASGVRDISQVESGELAAVIAGLEKLSKKK